MMTEINITTGMLTVEMMTEITITEILMVETQEIFHPQVNNIKIGLIVLIVVVIITDQDLMLAHPGDHLSEDRDARPMVDIILAVITEELQVENLNRHLLGLLHLVAHRQRKLRNRAKLLRKKQKSRVQDDGDTEKGNDQKTKKTHKKTEESKKQYAGRLEEK